MAPEARLSEARASDHAEDPGREADAPGRLTQWLRSADAGDRDALDRVYRVLYPRLLASAARLMRPQAAGITLDAEALVGEAFLKVNRTARRDWQHSGQFLALMSRAMRQVLIDHARLRKSLRRGGDRCREPLVGARLEFASTRTDTVDLHDALEALRELERCRSSEDETPVSTVIELRFFQGLTMREVAEHTGRAKRTVERDWDFGRTWLGRRLAE